MVTFNPHSSSPSLLPRKQSSGGHENCGGAGRRSKSTGLHRPCTREVSSRYSSTAPSSPSLPLASCHIPSPSMDRITTLLEAASPASRAQSAERRCPSLTRTPDARTATFPLDSSSSTKRGMGRGESLWPSIRSSSSSSPSSMKLEHYHYPPSNVPSWSRCNIRLKGFNQSSDHALKSSVNISHRSIEQHRGTPERKGTPLKCRILDKAENARPQENVHSKVEEHCWPGSSSIMTFTGSVSKSVDLTTHGDKQISRAGSLLVQGKAAYSIPKVPQPASFPKNTSQSISEGSSASSLQGSHVESKRRGRDSPRRLSGRTSAHKSNDEFKQVMDHIGPSEEEMELTSVGSIMAFENALNVESASSGNNLPTIPSRTTQENGIIKVTRTIVPARFWQDASGRSRHLSESNKLQPSMSTFMSASELPSLPAGKYGSGPKRMIVLSETQRVSNISAKSSGSLSSTSALNSSLLPRKMPQTVLSMRSLPSPTRSRGSSLLMPTNNLHSKSGSITALSVTVAVGQKGKKGLSQLEEAQLLRINHNRLLQWRFINARTETAMSFQRLSAEKSLYSVCSRITELQVSTRIKKIKLQKARQSEKISFLLSAQASKLESWSTLQEKHSTALTGAIDALEFTTLRVPVTAGVRADVQTVKDAMGSAVNLMDFVEPFITILTPKALKMNSLVAEVVHAAAQGRALLEECRELLFMSALLEAEECSLIAHLIQLEQEKERVVGNLMGSTEVAADSVLYYDSLKKITAVKFINQKGSC